MVVAGAQITITQTDTAQARTAVSNADGGYTLPNLPVGPYQLKVTKEGFKSFTQAGIVLQVNGRVATELIFLSGLATSAPNADLNTNKNFPTVAISVAGGLANGMTYVMDGGTHNDPFNNLNLPMPFPDALQEFKVETSALPARYGHHAASAVNVVTKTGGNQYHGDAFWFVRNYAFNAWNFFAGQTMQFRWETFNVPNRLNANAPVVALNNANFGRILTAQDPRIMQFALKYVFQQPRREYGTNGNNRTNGS